MLSKKDLKTLKFIDGCCDLIQSFLRERYNVEIIPLIDERKVDEDKMACIDYGSVVKKNGVVIQKDFFMDMKKAVGFVDDKLNGDYFSYIGDEDLLICIYKCTITIFSKGEEIIKLKGANKWEDPWCLRKKSRTFKIKGVTFWIKELFQEDNFKLHFTYKDDTYDCVYGYGVDINKDILYVTKNQQRKVDKWFE